MAEGDLLRSYLQTRDREALSRIVDRYIGMVYAAALRQVGDTHLAEDVTQSVFAILVKKADGLGEQTVLSAWLLVVTRYVAINARRRESRNKRRELEVARMKSESAQSPPVEHQEVLGAVDEALSRLNQRDREAIALRYFEGYDVPKLAAALGVSAGV
jgi:RNA polymerase sigma factor (sigma-70 family)